MGPGVRVSESGSLPSRVHVQGSTATDFDCVRLDAPLDRPADGDRAHSLTRRGLDVGAKREA
ncbi:hypothetical protein F1880_006529 [Penicillium rolfsii]|nr:hypothetical protein F1880_006529 [Penicillium rolfsii]